MQAHESNLRHLDLPPWAAFAWRLGRRLLGTAAILVGLFFALELAAYHLFPDRSTRCLLAGESNGEAAWTDNPFFPYRFFPERTARAPDPRAARQAPRPGTLRVCLLGGSEVMGDPEPAHGLGRHLEVLLQARYPGLPVEVLTLALDGANSHVLREMSRELRRLQPQAVVVLTGNDEVSGPYGPAAGLGRFHHSSTIARIMVLFSRTHLAQLCIAFYNRVFPERVELDAWRSQEPISLKGRMAPGDRRLKAVARSFRRNLAAIYREAARAAPAVVACTVPVNLRDCAPFSTSFAPDETVAQQVRETLRAAVAAEAATNLNAAARLYAGAIRLDPTHAEALFRAARMALRGGHYAEAAALFARARDADALRLRADSRLNAIVRECAVESGVSLLDAEALFAMRSPQGIPGREFFLDHVHFTFEANHLLAAALLDRLEFLHAFDAEPTGPLPGPDAVADELLYEPWGRAAQWNALVSRQLRTPFRRQFDHAETLARLNAERKAAQARVAALSADTTRAIFARRRASRPDDAWLAAREAWYLIATGQPAAAEEPARTAWRRWPHRYETRGLLALARALQGQSAANGIAFIRGAGRDSGYYDIEQAIAIGTGPLRRQDRNAALPWLEYALRRDPWNSEAAAALADTLHHLGRNAEAVELLQDQIERNPRHALLWEEIASLYCLLGDWKLATSCFRKSEELAPYRYERLLKWADALIRLKQFGKARGPLNRYLAVLPDDPEALAMQSRILENLPPAPEPAAESEEAKSSRRFPWE